MAGKRKFHSRKFSTDPRHPDEAHVARIAAAFQRIGLTKTEPPNRGENPQQAFERISRLSQNRISLVGVFDNTPLYAAKGSK